MNKNHFIMSYFGNKRKETPLILENINIDNKEIIIEPFCGSCAFSYFISTKYPKKFKYVLNDCDNNLIEIMKIMKDKKKTEKFNLEINKLMMQIIDKNSYNEIIKQNNLYGWFIARKIFSIRPALYKINYKYNKDKPFKLQNYPIYDFINSEEIIFKNNDAIDIIEEYKNNINALLFIDPPYLITCNDFYCDTKNLNIYEYLNKNNIKNYDAYFVIVLEKNLIIDLLFKDYFKIEYNKTYQTTKKKTIHQLILNK